MSRLSSHFGLQDPRLQSLAFPLIVPTTVADAAAHTYTPAELLTGFILRECSAGNRTDVLPTAALLVDAIQGAMVDTAFEVMFRNVSAASGTLTLSVGAGGTFAGGTDVTIGNSRTYLFVLTNVTIGSEAYTVYSKGAGGAY